MVHVRLDQEVKARATETLAAMGPWVSDAIRVSLIQVVAELQLSFPLNVPNAEIRAAMAEGDAITQTRAASETDFDEAVFPGACP